MDIPVSTLQSVILEVRCVAHSEVPFCSGLVHRMIILGT